MESIELSVKLFEDGYLCSQAVFAAFSENYGLSKKEALKIGACFGSGMRKAEVCGACTGALMVLGLKFGEDRVKSNELCERFLDEFKNENGSYLCRDLLNSDISTEEGRQYAIENNLFNELCPKMVESASRIVEEILKND